jgi:hypothetical protein
VYTLKHDDNWKSTSSFPKGPGFGFEPSPPPHAVIMNARPINVVRVLVLIKYLQLVPYQNLWGIPMIILMNGYPKNLINPC